MTPSCTAALEMAAMLCGLGPGDEVIVPSFTFVSTANAFVRLGARPVFVDIRPDTLNIDETLIEQAITPRTKAIFPVHYAGVACEMDRDHGHRPSGTGLCVVEDAAQGVNAFYEETRAGLDRPPGHVQLPRDEELHLRRGRGPVHQRSASSSSGPRSSATRAPTAKQFFRGNVDKYTWVDVGSSYVPSEICSAFLYAQLGMLEDDRRKAPGEFTSSTAGWLEPLEAEGLAATAADPGGLSQQLPHVLYSACPTARPAMNCWPSAERGIHAVFHYVPLHSSPMGRKFGYAKHDLPVTNEISGRLLRLPFYYEMSAEEQYRVVDRISDFLVCRRNVFPAATLDNVAHVTVHTPVEERRGPSHFLRRLNALAK